MAPGVALALGLSTDQGTSKEESRDGQQGAKPSYSESRRNRTREPARKPRPHELPLQFLPANDGSGLAAEAMHILDRALIGSTESSVASPLPPAGEEVARNACHEDGAHEWLQMVIDEHVETPPSGL